jgi:hypothetical protein
VRNATKEPGPELPRGELAARVFERLEQRQSLAEIVIGVRVAPEVVRELHHEWLVGLVEGEIDKLHAPALPRGELGQARERRVDVAELARLLGDLPMSSRTRLSVARDLGNHHVFEMKGEVRRVAELGGFVVLGPIEPVELARRYGRGTFRVTAYGYEPPGVRWEVFVRLDRWDELAALAAALPALLTPATGGDEARPAVAGGRFLLDDVARLAVLAPEPPGTPGEVRSVAGAVRRALGAIRAVSPRGAAMCSKELQAIGGAAVPGEGWDDHDLENSMTYLRQHLLQSEEWSAFELLGNEAQATRIRAVELASEHPNTGDASEIARAYLALCLVMRLAEVKGVAAHVVS